VFIVQFSTLQTSNQQIRHFAFLDYYFVSVVCYSQFCFESIRLQNNIDRIMVD